MQILSIVLILDRFYVLNETKTVAKKFGIPGQEWATKARDLAMKELPNPSLNTLMVPLHSPV